MKKLLLGIILSSLIVTTTFAKTEQVTANGKSIVLDVQEQNGRRLYPLRAVCNALGIQIVSVEGSRIQLQQEDNVVYYFIGQKLVANNTGYFNIDVAPISINNTVYVPIKTIGSMFGYNINLVNGGLTLTKAKSFTQPKATYASNLLMEDLTLAEDIVELIDPQYYLAAIQRAMVDSDWSYISTCKEYVLNDEFEISSISTGLKTQSGKAVYSASAEFLDSIYNALCQIQRWDITGTTQALQKVGSASKQLIEKRQALVDAIYKASGKI